MCFGDRLLVNLFLKPKYKIYLFKIPRKPGELLLKTENSLEVKYSNERWRKEDSLENYFGIFCFCLEPRPSG